MNSMQGWYGSSWFGRLAGLLIVAAGLATSAVPVSAQTGDPGGTVASDEMLLFTEIPSVYGASRYQQKVTEAPSSVSIVNADDIKKYGYRTLADILKSVRSFYVTYDRNYSYVGVRGFGRPGDYNGRILLLVDGHRLNDNVFDQALVGTEGVIDVDLIDRVEVIRGPGSSLYGSNAFFAVINVITRSGRDVKGAEVSAEGASFGGKKGRLTYGDRYKSGLEAVVSATGFESEGQRLYFAEFDPANPAADPRAGNGGYAEKSTDEDQAGNFFMKAAAGDFTISSAYSSREKHIPTASFETDFNDPRTKTADSHAYADVKYERSAGAKTEATARLYYDYYRYEGDYFYSGTGVNKDFAYGDWWGSEVKLTTQALAGNRIIAGAEYQDNIRQDQTNYDLGGDSYLDKTSSSTKYAFFAQDEITIATWVLLNAGVRYDHYDNFGGTTNPRAALIFTPLKKSSIKLLYGQAFRAPNVYELYYEIAGLQAANPDLKPEKIKTYELVYEQYLSDTFRTTLAGYYYKISDLISQSEIPDPDDPLNNTVTQYDNISMVRTSGVEAELESKRPSGFDGRVSYSFQKSTDVATGEVLTNSPKHLAKANLVIPVLPSKVFAGIEEQYVSMRKTETGGEDPGFWTTNLTLSARHFAGTLELSLSVYNLFDKEYGDPVSVDHVQETIEQDGRSWRAKLAYRF
jgi:iron complex outermembrane receptor protein